VICARSSSRLVFSKAAASASTA